jgi:hypothetical protein
MANKRYALLSEEFDEPFFLGDQGVNMGDLVMFQTC